jgi:hypothetical protein
LHHFCTVNNTLLNFLVERGPNCAFTQLFFKALEIGCLVKWCVCKHVLMDGISVVYCLLILSVFLNLQEEMMEMQKHEVDIFGSNFCSCFIWMHITLVEPLW